jgi:anti-anti-sigma factor
MQIDKLQVEMRSGSARGTRIVRLTGSVTLDSCFDLQDVLRSEPETFLILEMPAVKFVDSSGIGCLVNGYMAHHMAGGRLVLAGANERVRETLEETRVTQFLAVYDSVEQAEKEALQNTYAVGRTR